MIKKIDWQYIKFIALILMTIDHIGAVLFPEVESLRVIGRLSFPVFLFMIINSYTYTSDKKRFLSRIAVFSFVSAYPYYMAFGTVTNIGFTFLLTLIVVGCLDICDQSVRLDGRVNIRALFLAAVVVLYVFLAGFKFGGIEIDYSYGIFSIAMGVLIFYRKHLGLINFGWLSALFSFLYGLMEIEQYTAILVSLPVYWLLVRYEDSFSYGKQTAFSKYLYYVYYPLHLIVLGLLR